MADEAAEARRQIEATYGEFGEALSSGQYGKLADLYTEDGVLMVHGGDVIRGRNNIKECYEGAFKDIILFKTEKFIFFELLNENTAFTNEFTMSESKDGPPEVVYTSAVFWKKVDRKWLFCRYIFNLRHAPPSPNDNIPVALTLGDDWEPAKPGAEDAERAQIETRSRELYDVSNNRDYEAVANMYTEDAVFIADQKPCVVGRKAIRAVMEKVVPMMGTFILEDTMFFELANATSAVTNANVRCVDGQGEVKAAFRDMLLWKKIGGQWYIRRDLFNKRPSADI